MPQDAEAPVRLAGSGADAFDDDDDPAWEPRVLMHEEAERLFKEASKFG